jgi:RNA polymerase I-specific transcription initiation factor RRN7
MTKHLLAVLYGMSKKLAQALCLPLVLHNISAPKLRGLKQNDPRVHKSDNVPPEVALISTAIVVLRLVYGLDGRTRYVFRGAICTDADGRLTARVPSHPGDPAYAFPKLDEYIASLRQLNEEDDRSIDNVLSTSTEMYGIPTVAVKLVTYPSLRHVQELSTDELDEFLDFCAEKALTDISYRNGL